MCVSGAHDLRAVAARAGGWAAGGVRLCAQQQALGAVRVLCALQPGPGECLLLLVMCDRRSTHTLHTSHDLNLNLLLVK